MPTNQGPKAKYWLIKLFCILVFSALPITNMICAEPASKRVVLASKIQIENGQVEPGGYIVSFKSDGLKTSYSHYEQEYEQNISQLRWQFDSDPVVEEMSFITSIDMENPGSSNDYEAQPWGVKSLSKHQPNPYYQGDKIGNITYVKFVSPETAKEKLRIWELEGRLWFAEPNYISQLSGLFDVASNGYGDIANNAWWLKMINLNAAFEYLELGAGRRTSTDEDLLSRPPVIAVLDSGIDTTHPDIIDQLWENKNIGASGCSNDQFGCNTTKSTKGSLGTGNVVPFTTSSMGDVCVEKKQEKGLKDSTIGTCWHGTHVSGTIAGAPTLETGVSVPAAGVCPVCKIMTLRVVNEKTGNVEDRAIIKAFKYLSLFTRVDQNLVRIINASLGKFDKSKAVGLLVRQLRNSGRGVLVIGASGNETTQKRSFPAAFPDAIAVAAVDRSYRRAPYSNFGSWVDISAPGGLDESTTEGITAPIPGGIYGGLKGTSMATPVVSGVAGLLVAQNPNISFKDLRTTLIRTASEENLYGDSAAGGYNGTYFNRTVKDGDWQQPLLGAGLVDAAAAVENRAQGATTVEFIDRVNRGCAVVRGPNDSREGLAFWLMVFLFLWPFAFSKPE